MSELVAKYIGGNAQDGYRVNVKTANPTGKIGDAGLIRRFETKEEAKNYTAFVNQTGQDSFVKKATETEEKLVLHQGDIFKKS